MAVIVFSYKHIVLIADRSYNYPPKTVNERKKNPF